MWPTVTRSADVVFGREPSLGKYKIPGANDDPFSDRSIICRLRSRQYAPVQLSQALEDQRKRPLSTANLTSNGIDGYRVIHRQTLEFDSARLQTYTPACSLLAEKMARVIDVCIQLGYANVTRDVLRVVDGVHNNTVTILPNTLPVLIMPFWDFALSARIAVPSTDGSACVVRMGFGEVSSSGRVLSTTLSATPRRNREEKTAEWLGAYDGTWRNGWLELPADGSRWYSDLISDDPSDRYGVPWYDFDLDDEDDSTRGKLCAQTGSPCEQRKITSLWGSQLTVSIRTSRVTSIATSEGSRLGLFMFAAKGTFVIKSIYSLEKFVSNITLAGLSLQWLIALLTLQKRGETIGVGALANALSFKLLPILLLPRLKSTLEGFWTAGCLFEGDQMALSESWSVIYPAIGEFVLLFFSVLNTIAKLTRHRTSDVLFGPTLLYFTLLHYFRAEIGTSNLFGFDGRVASVVTAAEVNDISLFSYLATDLAFRINGKIKSLFGFKLSVLILNLVPLLVGSRRVGNGCSLKRSHGVSPGDEGRTNSLEVALAVHFDTNGGLGLSDVYTQRPFPTSGANPHATSVVPYELLRAGYVFIGSCPSEEELSTRNHAQSPTMPSPIVIVSINCWCWLFVASPLSGYLDESFMPRLVVFPLQRVPQQAPRVEPDPLMCRLGDRHLHGLRVYNLSAWPTQ